VSWPWRSRATQPTYHLGRSPGLAGGMAHDLARELQIGRLVRFFGQQPLCGLGVGQHGGQRLVQLVGDAGCQLAQGVEARHLAQPQQLFGPLSLGALAPPGLPAPGGRQHQPRPGHHAPPGQGGPSEGELGLHIK
jgi:hypothetical protein